MTLEVTYYDITIDLTPRIDHPLGSVVPRKPTMAQILALQELVGSVDQVELEPEHYFAEGMYGRELFIPAGVVVVGKLHRHEHLVQLLSGDATVYTDKGMERICGPKTWVSPPGVKRAVLAHTDCTFFTVHLNESNTRDLGVIEEYVIAPDPVLTHDHPQLEAEPQMADLIQGVYA